MAVNSHNDKLAQNILNNMDAQSESHMREHYRNAKSVSNNTDKIRDFYKPDHKTTSFLDKAFSVAKHFAYRANYIYDRIAHRSHNSLTRDGAPDSDYKSVLQKKKGQTAVNSKIPTVKPVSRHLSSVFREWRHDYHTDYQNYAKQRNNERKQQEQKENKNHKFNLGDAMPKFSNNRVRQGMYTYFNEVYPAEIRNSDAGLRLKNTWNSNFGPTNKYGANKHDIKYLDDVKSNIHSVKDIQNNVKKGASYLSKHNLYVPDFKSMIQNRTRMLKNNAFSRSGNDSTYLKTLNSSSSPYNKARRNLSTAFSELSASDPISSNKSLNVSSASSVESSSVASSSISNFTQNNSSIDSADLNDTFNSEIDDMFRDAVKTGINNSSLSNDFNSAKSNLNSDKLFMSSVGISASSSSVSVHNNQPNPQSSSTSQSVESSSNISNLTNSLNKSSLINSWKRSFNNSVMPKLHSVQVAMEKGLKINSIKANSIAQHSQQPASGQPNSSLINSIKASANNVKASANGVKASATAVKNSATQYNVRPSQDASNAANTIAAVSNGTARYYKQRENGLKVSASAFTTSAVNHAKHSMKASYGGVIDKMQAKINKLNQKIASQGQSRSNVSSMKTQSVSSSSVKSSKPSQASQSSVSGSSVKSSLSTKRSSKPSHKISQLSRDKMSYAKAILNGAKYHSYMYGKDKGKDNSKHIAHNYCKKMKHWGAKIKTPNIKSAYKNMSRKPKQMSNQRDKVQHYINSHRQSPFSGLNKKDKHFVKEATRCYSNADYYKGKKPVSDKQKKFYNDRHDDNFKKFKNNYNKLSDSAKQRFGELEKNPKKLHHLGYELNRDNKQQKENNYSGYYQNSKFHGKKPMSKTKYQSVKTDHKSKISFLNNITEKDRKPFKSAVWNQDKYNWYHGKGNSKKLADIHKNKLNKAYGNMSSNSQRKFDSLKENKKITSAFFNIKNHGGYRRTNHKQIQASSAGRNVSSATSTLANRASAASASFTKSNSVSSDKDEITKRQKSKHQASNEKSANSTQHRPSSGHSRTQGIHLPF